MRLEEGPTLLVHWYQMTQNDEKVLYLDYCQNYWAQVWAPSMPSSMSTSMCPTMTSYCVPLLLLFSFLFLFSLSSFFSLFLLFNFFVHPYFLPHYLTIIICLSLAHFSMFLGRAASFAGLARMSLRSGDIGPAAIVDL